MSYDVHYLQYAPLPSKKHTGSSILQAEDFMDDGTVIKLKITIADDVSWCRSLAQYRELLLVQCSPPNSSPLTTNFQNFYKPPHNANTIISNWYFCLRGTTTWRYYTEVYVKCAEIDGVQAKCVLVK